MSELLEVTDLRIAAGERTIVDTVSFALDAGESVALVGESGSGKSMTARALTGLLPAGVAATGSVRFEGTDLLSAANRRLQRSVRGGGISLLLQDPFTMLNPLTTVGQQLAETLGSRERSEIARRLAEVGIDADVARRYPFELSGGMRQRVAIAAAIAKDPRLLLADEPTTALDTTTQREVLRLIWSIQRDRGMGLLLITHDMRVAFALCDRVLVMYAGTLLEAASPRELATQPLHPYTAGLLAAEPPLDRRSDRLGGIPGRVPRPDDLADECVFGPRCDWRTEVCAKARPVLELVGAAHSTACVRHDTLAPDLAAVPQRAAAAPVAELERAPTLLSVRGLTKTFGSTRAVDDVNFELREGRHLAIVGESGSGKTTIARCLLGLETPTAGTISLPEGPVQCVFQDPYSSLNPSHSVGFALAEAVRLGPGDTSVAELLRQVGLPSAYARRRPAALSGGERQRVAIARALALRPRVLVCDEPVAALDVSVQAQVLDLLRTVGANGTTLVFITHDLAVARQLTDEMIVLRRGKVVETGTTERLLTAPEHEYTRALLEAVPTGTTDWLQ
ncbi:dipeptide ABC transporter ATP-binding protein [Tenggerimyces flavus]|uniref:Dipeptide ABC transporter ATP-binding protein n=1 Tax=Tenggerimyces flavus TaxID=1708749 RepID=A0ABV7YIS9_9ACTN|nr:ABC transporter ATP-binding protein [Tenggerimyces flavus]MBM7785876.1 peptide/nickel transport system ATP-binding protein [Tenggerimyces flavus]